ncbi:MAG TPA: gliding motility-associated C-terminal domain-containing protein [Cyclobacteriaceae bacterium]|nr:gliding motility-associated C-terminal domain-containing protein [Cyclobacteriaceae bacterium]
MLSKKGLFIVLAIISFFCDAQSTAPCPAADTCGTCAGGMISLTLQYNGVSTAGVSVEDNKSPIFSAQVTPNEKIVLVPQGHSGFVGNTLQIKVNDVLNTSINTKCNIPIFINAIYGDFTVFAGSSKTGGSICCIPKPPNPPDPTQPPDPNQPSPVEQLGFSVSKVITPNGDGTNDVLVLYNVEVFSETSVIIVDRWGSVVFKASGYNNRTVAWDGEIKGGGSAPTGTYFYTFRGVAGTLKVEKQGSIELIR